MTAADGSPWVDLADLMDELRADLADEGARRLWLNEWTDPPPCGRDGRHTAPAGPGVTSCPCGLLTRVPSPDRSPTP